MKVTKTKFKKRGLSSKKSLVKKAVAKVKIHELKKIVKQVNKERTENKEAYHTSNSSSLTFVNGGINSTADMLQIVPNVTQGTGDASRVGDQCRIQNFSIKGYLKLNINQSFNSTTLPSVIARLFVVSLKTKPNYTEASSSATPLSGLLKKGGSTTGWTGVLSDIYANVNSELWTTHYDKVFYLNQPFLLQPPTLNAISLPVDIKNTIKFFHIKLKCKDKLIKYDSNISTGLLPTNYGPMLLLGYAFADGSSVDLASNLGLHFDSYMSYEDA